MTGAQDPHSGRWEQQSRIVKAVRQLYDERANYDPSIEEIGRTAGINKALIYRHVTSKEELVLLVYISYLTEIADLFQAIDENLEPRKQLDLLIEAYLDFALRHPAYMHCVIALIRQPADELARRVSMDVLVRVNRLNAVATGRLSRVLGTGRDSGVFDPYPKDADLDYLTHLVYAAALGILYVVHFGIGTRETTGPYPDLFMIDKDRAMPMLIDMLHAVVGVKKDS